MYLISDDGFKNVNAFVIVDLKCNSTKSKHHIEVSKCAEISLICSNQKHRIKGLMTILLDKVITDLIPTAKPNCRYILLVPSRQNRSKLEKYYEQFGFKVVEDKERYSVMKLDLFNRPKMRPFTFSFDAPKSPLLPPMKSVNPILSPVTKTPVYSHRSTSRSRSRDRVTEKSRSRSRSRSRSAVRR